MKRAIVTGASGFIGYHLANYLSGQGEMEVTVIDNFARGTSDGMFQSLIEKPNVIFIKADMTEKTFYSALSGRYDYVYHLAAINGTKNFYEKLQIPLAFFSHMYYNRLVINVSCISRLRGIRSI